MTLHLKPQSYYKPKEKQQPRRDDNQRELPGHITGKSKSPHYFDCSISRTGICDCLYGE